MRSFPAMGTWIEISSPSANPPSALSFPAMGTWIEIPPAFTYSHGISLFPAMGTWIEISSPSANPPSALSFPAMGTWIEIFHGCEQPYCQCVVPMRELGLKLKHSQ